jgi:hypothetical protein
VIAEGADDRGGSVRLVAAHLHEGEGKHLRNLLGYSGEHLRRRRSLCDERGDSPQCGLLVNQPAQVLLGLRMRDRRAD